VVPRALGLVESTGRLSVSIAVHFRYLLCYPSFLHESARIPKRGESS
jgi:hypothetical protein